MKYAVKKLALAATLVASGLANAAPVTVAPGGDVVITGSQGSAKITFVEGSGALEFSNGTGVAGGVPTTSVGGLVGALNVGKVKLTSVDGASITETPVKIGRDQVRGVVKIGASVTSVTADDTTGVVSAVGSFGGAQQDAAYLSGVLNGGRVVVKNLQFDLIGKKVYADLYGQALDEFDVLGPVQTSLHTGLWDITSISGPTVVPPDALFAAAGGDPSALAGLGYAVTPNATGFDVSATNVLSNLKVTTEGFKFFSDYLGLTPGSTGYTTLNGVNGGVDGWGSVTSNLKFTVATVPEPSTYALAGVGLLVALATRRRQQQA